MSKNSSTSQKDSSSTKPSLLTRALKAAVGPAVALASAAAAFLVVRHFRK